MESQLPPPEQTRTRRLANAIRALSLDAVAQAKSGHPGLPLGMADAATVLFGHFLTYDPANPHWPDRDRFVLSAGHGSMLLYSLFYLPGYARPTDLALRLHQFHRAIGSGGLEDRHVRRPQRWRGAPRAERGAEQRQAGADQMQDDHRFRHAVARRHAEGAQRRARRGGNRRRKEG